MTTFSRFIYNSKIKLVQLKICTTKTKLDHYYSSRVDYRSAESFLENSQLTWCIYSTVGDGRSSLRPRVHYTKMSYRTHIDMEIWQVSPRGRRGSMTGTTAVMMEGLLDFYKNKNPISYQLIKCIRLA